MGIQTPVSVRPDAQVDADEIGLFFSWDEENTVELVLEGRVAGGGVANLDYQGSPPEIMNQLGRFGQTIPRPGSLYRSAPGWSLHLVSEIRDLLGELDRTGQGRRLLEDLKRTSRFDSLDADSLSSLR